jgi:hypothetical protein
MRRVRRLGAVLLAGALVILLTGAWVLSEGALRRPLPLSGGHFLEGETTVEVTAPDGVRLRGALARGAAPESAVLLFHGASDSRRGVARPAAFLHAAGFTTLRADLRAHGASDGGRLSFGVVERTDAAAWVRFLREAGARRVFGLGVSMGASILLQSPDGFTAIVADSPFSCFPAIATFRLARATRWPPGLAAPFVHVGLWIERLRNGNDLRKACPEITLRNAATPVLLIHGERDADTPAWHSRRLAEVCGAHCTLMIAREAGHTMALAVAEDEYRKRVLEFFGR